MTQSNESRPPSLARPTPRLAWAVVWIVVVAIIGTLLANDARLDTHVWLATRWAVGDQGNYTFSTYHAAHAAAPNASPAELATRPFYWDDIPPMDSHFFRQTAWLWNFFKFFGSFGAALLGLAAVTAFARPRWRATIPAAIALAAGNATALIAFVFGRDRPNQHDGMNHWTLFRGFHEHKNLSFPSSHATAAFALAAVLAFYFPKTKWFMLPLAAACAFSRVVMEAHFYSDILAGALLGGTTAWFVARTAQQSLARRLSQTASPHV